jgi:hypothetical protein
VRCIAVGGAAAFGAGGVLGVRGEDDVRAERGRDWGEAFRREAEGSVAGASVTPAKTLCSAALCWNVPRCRARCISSAATCRPAPSPSPSVSSQRSGFRVREVGVLSYKHLGGVLLDAFHEVGLRLRH